MADGNQTTNVPRTLSEAKQRGSEIAVVAHGRGHLPAFANMGQVMEYAAAMAGSGSMIRAPLRGNVGACLGIIETASRFGIAPFALAAKAYLVNDNIAYESQAINAMIYATGYLEGRLKYRFEGEGDNLKVTVTGRIKGEPEVLELETPLKRDIKPQNSPLWKTDPQMQIGYYGSRAWCRRHAPDLLMGIYDVDEFERGVVNVTPAKSDDPAAKLSASIERSSQERAEAAKARADDPVPDEPEPQDAEFEEGSDAGTCEKARPASVTDQDDSTDMTEDQVLRAYREELESGRKAEPEAPAPQGDLLGGEPATDANGAKLKKPAPSGQTSAAKAVEDALDAATSPEVKEPPTSVIPTAEGAEAYAQSWAAWYRSLTKAERGDLNIGGKFDRQMDQAARISDEAKQIISDAMNSPAADEEV
ncbi:MAG: recombinase RecT [Alphaproteobacteria bacterium]|nr:recombinase RecT [Alphaproteobacteria bacterium]